MTKTDIETSLLKQLASKGAEVSHFTDMIGDYVSLWKVKNKLISDINKRGVTFKDFSSVGIEMMKNNPSVKELVGVNRQMLMILRELGLNTDGVKPEKQEDENPDNL